MVKKFKKMNKTRIYLILFSVIIIFFLFIKKDKIVWKHDESGGWTVGLVKIPAGYKYQRVFEKIENGEVLKIDNSLVSISDSVIFLADPFLFRHNDSLFLFVETQIHGRGAIITTFYIDTFGNPKYLGVAMRESFHLSYPQIVKFKDDIFMIPESQAADTSFIYRATSFPLKWKREGFLFPKKIKDPTILMNTDTSGYLYFGEKGKLYLCKLKYDNHGFVIGKREYLKTGSAFRPGGRPFKEGNYYWLPLQDNTKGYGTSSFAYRIKKNGRLDSKQSPLKLLTTSQTHSEFSHGMHHYCIDSLNPKLNIIAVDGNNKVSSKFNLSIFIKYNYLNLWDFIFGDSKEPWYPFNE
jgi:hypothetical protein